ncbi:MAG: hypothetical protein R3Y13_04920 [bacterium]
MNENSIVELENGDGYIVLDKIYYQNDIYYFCSKLTGNEKNAKDKVKFLIEKKENDLYYLAEITNQEDIDKLISIVKKLA